MTEEKQIMALKKEAEIYHSQGLLEQAKEKYLVLRNLAAKSDKYSKDEALNRYLKDKINLVNIDLDAVNDDEMDTPLLDYETQELIGDLFSFSDEGEMAAMESAVALAKFGQYGRALNEFTNLFEAGCFPSISAKNILRCHVMLSSPEKAVSQYNEWGTEGRFTSRELEELKGFLSSILGENSGLLSGSEEIETEGNNVIYYDNQSDYLEVYSICLFMKNGLKKIKKAEMKVTRQEENKISFVLDEDQKRLADVLLPGVNLSKVLCFSRESVFYTSAVILKKSRIANGPLKDCYTYDFLLEDPFYSASQDWQ
ncbi:hypothetical protein ACFL6W_06935 [Thermodesulfobacteriota bacterium]